MEGFKARLREWDKGDIGKEELLFFSCPRKCSIQGTIAAWFKVVPDSFCSESSACICILLQERARKRGPFGTGWIPWGWTPTLIICIGKSSVVFQLYCQSPVVQVANCMRVDMKTFSQITRILANLWCSFWVLELGDVVDFKEEYYFKR